MGEVVFTSMKQAMLFVSVLTILLESSVKVSQLDNSLCEEMSLVYNIYLFKMETSKHFSRFNIRVEIFVNKCFSDSICGKPAIPPVVISEKKKRIVEGMEVVPNSWPWQVSIQFHGELLN